ncbi:family transcriptional regulator [Leptolyngbya sp. Heron Island J]|uniref:TetR/AcrR family transcriptional regulator n=1 Tax=Leptolyngbya sp. Heron Island J TaxID=1385935 RepID=UPI0003B97BFD|nr:TetR/AcrR family transcriptional regulator [Leptolyngbya sp. Heron Island J]ESA33975.1 family transcriptional regulator [Leptolyngbya sp. Heron Island J]
MPRKSAATDKPLKEHILDVADRLFYTCGLHAVGVDRVIAEAKIAKTSLYRYFPSKDALIQAYLERRNQRFWQLLEASLADCEPESLARLVGMIDFIVYLLARPDCQGCPFLLTASEFADAEHLSRQVILAHKRQVCDRITILATAANLNQPQTLATQLTMLIDGGFSQVRYLDKVQVSQTFKGAATALITQAAA